MILLKIVRRYFPDWIMTSAVFATAWATSMWFLDGLIVWAMFFVSLIVVLGYIPYRLAQDFKAIKNYLSTLNQYRKGNVGKGRVLDETVTMACEATGIPEEIVRIFIKTEGLDGDRDLSKLKEA